MAKTLRIINDNVFLYGEKVATLHRDANSLAAIDFLELITNNRVQKLEQEAFDRGYMAGEAMGIQLGKAIKLHDIFSE